jgi:hypothetical protein
MVSRLNMASWFYATVKAMMEMQTRVNGGIEFRSHIERL